MLRELDAYRRLPLPVVSAEGCELVLSNGRRVLDLYGGHCVNTLGAGDPALGELLFEQWRGLSFVTNLIDHAPRVAFLEAFGRNLPSCEGGWRVFCCNSGAEADENAIKIALAVTQRRRVVTFNGAFHGRTAGAAAVSDDHGKGYPWPRTPFEVSRVPFGHLDAAQEAVDATVAAVVLEPIQSLAGVIDPPSGFLEGLREACDAAGALLIYDEVQTGNGRLGQPFAAQHFGVQPDVITTAKGAGGGFPIGLTIVRESFAERLPPGLFGSTFGGGPLVLAAATEVAQRIAAPGFLENVRDTSVAFRKACLRGPVTAVRGAGLLLGLELEPGVKATDVRDQLLERDVLVGTSNDPSVLRLSPPLILEPAAAARLADALESLTAVSA
jgi:acetylornithine aminotransferase/acetylornithine/N-succinyldiaminopimelate aminotransferase